MSGHSKWAKIKHKKGKTDIAKGKIFSKLIREITTAARIGGGDLSANPRLITVIESARAVNMPADNIERAIKKGTGELPGVAYEEVEYEGYGPAGVAMIVRALTDNKNRTTADVRHAFEKYGGNLGAAGSVAWQFHPKGIISIAKGSVDEDKILAVALESGADDVRNEADSILIITPPESFSSVKDRLKEEKIEWTSAEFTKLPQTTLPLDEKNAAKVLRLYEALEELDEVSQVYANFDIADELMEKLTSNA